MIIALFNLTNDKNLDIAKNAVLCLVNLTDHEGAVEIFEMAKKVHPKLEIVDVAVKHITDENSNLAEPWSMVLSNLTRLETLAEEILNELEKDPEAMINLAKAFIKLDYNKKKANLEHLAYFFCNLTQIARGREFVCHNKYNLLDKILAFASYKESIVRRRGTIGILENICFDPIYHDIILREEDDILSAILYPLCGPEEYSDEENDKLPLELQYLPETKTRESDPNIRKMLLDALLQLCCTRKSREHLREKGVYEILREHHKWENKEGKDYQCISACEKVVDILIKKEDEIGLDNYREVDVPNDLADKFVEEDQEYLKQLQQTDE